MAAEKKSQVDDAFIDYFTQNMKREIETMLDMCDFQSKYINQWVEKINDTAQSLLKTQVKNHKFITDCILLPRGSGYVKKNAFWWQPKTDKAITVKVDTDNLHCLVVCYCIKV